LNSGTIFPNTAEAVIFVPTLWTEEKTGGSCLEETLEMGSIPYPNIAIFYGDNDDHRIFWGIIVLLGRGTPKNISANYKLITIKLGNRCHFIWVCHIPRNKQKMSISFESIVFLHRKMLKSSKPFNNHFTKHFSPEPDAHCSGRCPLQIALQRSLTLLSRKPQLSTWVLLKTLVPRCENTKIRRTWMFIPQSSGTISMHQSPNVHKS